MLKSEMTELSCSEFRFTFNTVGTCKNLLKRCHDLDEYFDLIVLPS